MSRITLQSRMRTQDAVYWAKTAVDGYSQATYAAPVDIKVRWMDQQEEFVAEKGEKLISKAKVFPGQDTSVYGYWFRGTIADLPSDATDPEALKDDYDLFQSMAKQSDPNIRNTDTVYRIWLV